MSCRFIITIVDKEVCGCLFNTRYLKSCKIGCLFTLSPRMIELNETISNALKIAKTINRDWSKNFNRVEEALVGISNLTKYGVNEAIKEEVCN